MYRYTCRAEIPPKRRGKKGKMTQQAFRSGSPSRVHDVMYKSQAKIIMFQVLSCVACTLVQIAGLSKCIVSRSSVALGSMPAHAWRIRSAPQPATMHATSTAH